MKRILGLFDPDEGPIVWFIGAVMIMLALFGGVSVIIAATAGSWAER